MFVAISDPIMDPVSGRLIGTAYAESDVERNDRLAREFSRKYNQADAFTILPPLPDVDAPTKSIRAGILEEAARLIDGERDQQYAPPKVNFTRIAALWSAYNGNTYTPQDVAIMMTLLKISRLANNDMARDSWVDAAGYLACGAECVEEGVS